MKMVLLRKTFLKSFSSVVMSLIFTSHLLLPNPVYAIVITDGGVASINASFQPPVLKAVQINAQDPLALNFILDKSHLQMTSDEIKQESTRLIEYFLASLTTPEEDLWVNLSPYEQDRIVPKAFGETKMGRDLLLQDADLKQITASLFNPQNSVGKVFWEQVYQKMQKEFGTTDIPVDAFHKVWIVPQKVVVYENSDSSMAYIVESDLKVLTEADYLAMFKNPSILESNGAEEGETFDIKPILYDVIIPVLEKEINQGESFALLRQIYHSLILATWYKKRILNGFLSEGFLNQKKTQGFNIEKPEEVQEIWQQYTDFFQAGAFHLIHQDKDPISNEEIPKKYFSGGIVAQDLSENLEVVHNMDTSNILHPSESIAIKAQFSVISSMDKESKFMDDVWDVRPNEAPNRDAAQNINRNSLSTRRVVYNQGQYTIQYQSRKQSFKSWMSMTRALLHIYHREFDKLQKTHLIDPERVYIDLIIDHLEDGLSQNISQILSMRTADIQRRLNVLRSAVLENKPHIFIDSANGLNQLSWSKEPELEGVYTQIRVALRIVRDRGINSETSPLILKSLDEAIRRLLLQQNLNTLFLSYQKEYLQERKEQPDISHEKAQMNAFQAMVRKMELGGDEDQKPRILLLLYQLIFVSSRENPDFFQEINTLIHHRPLKNKISDLLTPTQPTFKPDEIPLPVEVQQAWDSFLLPSNQTVKGGVDLSLKGDSFMIEASTDSQGQFFGNSLSSFEWENISGLRTEIIDIQTMDIHQIFSFLDITPALSSHQ